MMLAQSQETETVPFMILQCKSCRTIVGDTGSLLSLQRESLIVTITRRSANVSIDGELETSKEGSDCGSTFNNLYCKSCGEWLGRCYRTTLPELDELRGNYTFDIGRLIMFELEAPFAGTQAEVQRPAPKIGAESVEIVKLQKFVVALYDRIEQLELESDTIRAEMSALNSRLSSQSEALSPSEAFFPPAKAKGKRVRANKVEREEPVRAEVPAPVQAEQQAPAQTEKEAAPRGAGETLARTGREAASRGQQCRSLELAAASVLNVGDSGSVKLDERGALEVVCWSILSGSSLGGVVRAISEAFAE